MARSIALCQLCVMAGLCIMSVIAMCSWCWGISPTVSAVEAFCAAQGIDFSITMGGLRAGGGDPWNETFKSFLRNEWRHIGQTTGQPFGFTLLESEYFNYDTEPACRAVATVKLLQARHQFPVAKLLKFFTAIQHKFYVEGQDTTQVDFTPVFAQAWHWILLSSVVCLLRQKHSKRCSKSLCAVGSWACAHFQPCCWSTMARYSRWLQALLAKKMRWLDCSKPSMLKPNRAKAE